MRFFIIERNGAEYRILKVIEAAGVVTPNDIKEIFFLDPSFSNRPDEKILAEQVYSHQPDHGKELSDG